MKRILMALSIIILMTAAAAFAGVCGDVNNTGTVNIQDVTFLINFLYKGGPAPVCCGDVNNTGTVNIQDITFLINSLYKGGPEPCSVPVTDIDGNIYHTVKIGDQWWLVENLKVTHYRNGDPIPNVTDDGTWEGLTTGAYCEYNNDINNVATYGRLYNWFAAVDSRNIAPAGWHVPSDAEWKQLEMYLGMSQAQADATYWRGTTEGGKMKEAGTTHWVSPNTGATNESGFSGLPGGCRYSNGPYFDVGNSAYFWSSTEYHSYDAWSRALNYSSSGVYRLNYYEQYGFSLRCIRDY